jgi:hypothetical protein
MIWELRGDYLPDGSHPLSAALKAAYRAHYGTCPGQAPAVRASGPPRPSDREP